MTFQHPEWIYLAVPLLLIAVGVRFWRRHYWGHPLVEQFRTEIGRPNPILRLPTILEAAAVVFLLIGDRKSTRLNSSHITISYAVFCLKKKQHRTITRTTTSKPFYKPIIYS